MDDPCSMRPSQGPSRSRRGTQSNLGQISIPPNQSHVPVHLVTYPHNGKFSPSSQPCSEDCQINIGNQIDILNFQVPPDLPVISIYSLQSETPTLLISTYKYGSATIGVEFQSLRDRAQSSGGPNILDVACLDVCDDDDADDLSGD